MRDGWTETALGDIAEVLDRLRKPISGAEREKRIGDVPYYGATGLAGWIDKPIFDEELVLLGEDAIDFLNPDVHKAYLISGPSWVNNHAHVLRAKREKVISYFLMEALNAVDYSQFVAFGTRSKLTQGAMMGISVRVPPLDEQKRIVDVVSSIDAYIDALQQQADSARTARNAVLHELLSNTGDDWTETTLGDALVHLTDGSHFSPETLSVGFPYVTVRDVRNGLIDLDGSAKISEESFIELKKNGCAPLPGDVLFSKDGTVGRTAQVTTETPFVVLSSLAILRPNLEILSSEFLTMTITSNDFQDMATGSKTGLAIKRVVLKVLRAFPIMLPPLAEQKQIVEIVSSMDVLIQSTEEAVMNAKALRSGVLSDLLSGDHEIPTSYDSLVGAA